MKVIITGTTGYVGEGVMRLLGFTNTLDEVARAMIACAKGKADHSVITVKDVTKLAKL